MTLAGTGVAWLFKVLLAAIPPSLLLWLWREMTAHSLYLYAQRIPDPDAQLTSYRFAVQNNEDVSLGTHKLQIHILDDDGRFVEGPLVYAGCNRLTPTVDQNARTLQLEFTELPAYETWTIDCRMNSAARNIRMDVMEADTRLSGNHLFLAADQISTLTGRKTATEWWWAWLAILLAIVSYVAVVVFRYGALGRADWPFAAAIIGFGGLLYAFSRIFSPRVAPPMIQGYWDAIKTDLKA